MVIYCPLLSKRYYWFTLTFHAIESVIFRVGCGPPNLRTIYVKRALRLKG